MMHPFPAPSPDRLAWAVSLLVPLAYLVCYTPCGMDTTDFGYFYGYAWRILQGEFPYRDFWYIKPSLPLFWHALWMKLTPEGILVLAGKAGFLVTVLASAWFSAIFLSRVFDLEKLGIPLPLLAVTGFVFGIHSFPHMPWHTADGVLFASAGLACAASGLPVLAGILTCAATLCKQSFLLVPAGTFLFLLVWLPRRRDALRMLLSWLATWAAVSGVIRAAGAWEAMTRMTTGQLAIREALEAGIGIYLTQNWWPPVVAALPALAALALRKKLPALLRPTLLYVVVLAIWYVHDALAQETWIGYGLSWPTLLVLLGGVMVLFPRPFTAPWLRDTEKPRPLLRASFALGLALLVSWSTAISGGYKTPAFFAGPLVFALALLHARLGGRPVRLLWTTLAAGLVMFAVGHHYPYTFPVRPLVASELTLDAGDIYPQCAGVRVDRVMYEKLAELKDLRARYGADYKTLPAFTLAYLLNRDKPRLGSDWLIDWEINAECETLYRQLVDRRLTVFMEKDQLEATSADGYARAGYTVPQWVRHRWRQVEETKHFVVFRPPLGEGATAP